jgi:hypothetical protein
MSLKCGNARAAVYSDFVSREVGGSRDPIDPSGTRNDPKPNPSSLFLYLLYSTTVLYAHSRVLERDDLKKNTTY